MIDPEGFLIESKGCPFPPTTDLAFHDQLKEGLWYINFKGGRTEYLIKDLPLTQKLLEANKDIKLRFLKLKTANFPIQRGILLNHPSSMLITKMVVIFVKSAD